MESARHKKRLNALHRALDQCRWHFRNVERGKRASVGHLINPKEAFRCPITSANIAGAF